MLSDAMKNKNLDDKTQAYLKQYVATNNANEDDEDDEDDDDTDATPSEKPNGTDKKMSMSPRDGGPKSPVRHGKSIAVEKANRRISVASDKTPRLELFGL